MKRLLERASGFTATVGLVLGLQAWHVLEDSPLDATMLALLCLHVLLLAGGLAIWSWNSST